MYRALLLSQSDIATQLLLGDCNLVSYKLLEINREIMSAGVDFIKRLKSLREIGPNTCHTILVSGLNLRFQS